MFLIRNSPPASSKFLLLACFSKHACDGARNALIAPSDNFFFLLFEASRTKTAIGSFNHCVPALRTDKMEKERKKAQIKRNAKEKETHEVHVERLFMSEFNSSAMGEKQVGSAHHDPSNAGIALYPRHLKTQQKSD